MAVVDTTFLIEIMKGTPSALHRLHEVEEFASPIRIPAAVWLEILTGVPETHRGAIRERLLAAATLCDFTPLMAERGALLQRTLLAAGRPLSWHDIQVAATALHFGEPLISNDAAFEAVPDLEWHHH